MLGRTWEKTPVAWGKAMVKNFMSGGGQFQIVLFVRHRGPNFITPRSRRPRSKDAQGNFLRQSWKAQKGPTLLTPRPEDRGQKMRRAISNSLVCDPRSKRCARQLSETELEGTEGPQAELEGTEGPTL